MSRLTNTFATLPVSSVVYTEVAALLRQAGYDHAFVGDAIDMAGIALVESQDQPSTLRPGLTYDAASDVLTIGTVAFTPQLLEKFIDRLQRGESIGPVLLRLEEQTIAVTQVGSGTRAALEDP